MNKYPPFHPGPANTNIDWMTEDGAKTLARIIRAAWADVGQDMPVDVIKVSTGKGGSMLQRPYWIIRLPVLVNGVAVAL